MLIAGQEVPFEGTGLSYLTMVTLRTQCFQDKTNIVLKNIFTKDDPLSRDDDGLRKAWRGKEKKIEPEEKCDQKKLNRQLF